MGMTLVTGATGYLGRHLIDSLVADGLPVRALVYSEWKAEPLVEQGAEVVFGDVTEPETLIDCVAGGDVDTVFHLVGGGHDGRADPFLINTEGTRNVLDACRQERLRAFVYVSSSSVYGRQSDPVDETTPPAPRCDYPQSKLDAENLLLAAARETGFPAMIARMAGIYGPEAPMLGTDLVQRGRLRITGDGRNAISVLHVEDAVQALRAMAARGRPGQIYCLGDDEPVPALAFHSHFAQLLGAPPIRTTSLRKVRAILGVLAILSKLVGSGPPLTKAVIEMSTLNVMMRNGRMRDELGVELRYPTYREGLAHCADVVLAEEEE